VTFVFIISLFCSLELYSLVEMRWFGFLDRVYGDCVRMGMGMEVEGVLEEGWGLEGEEGRRKEEKGGGERRRRRRVEGGGWYWVGSWDKG